MKITKLMLLALMVGSSAALVAADIADVKLAGGKVQMADHRARTMHREAMNNVEKQLGKMIGKGKNKNWGTEQIRKARGMFNGAMKVGNWVRAQAIIDVLAKDNDIKAATNKMQKRLNTAVTVAMKAGAETTESSESEYAETEEAYAERRAELEGLVGEDPAAAAAERRAALAERLGAD